MFSTDFKSVENEVTERSGSYKGLTQEALLTSEEDFKTIFEALPEIQTWVEPGSGHGLGPLLFAKLNPTKSAIGIEFEEARFAISEKLKQQAALTNVEFKHQDLLEHNLPQADSYFFYFPTGIVLDRILHSFKTLSTKFRIIAIESHGDLLPRLKKEAWLKEVKQIPLTSARYFPYAVVFENGGVATSSLHDVSFLKKYLLIEDGAQAWWAESFGLEWQGDDRYLLQTPPRTISEDQVKRICGIDEVARSFHPALTLRSLGELRIETSSGLFVGKLRKIFVSPSFKLEISSGEQVEWSQITKIFWENTLCFDSSSDYFYFPHVV